MQYNFKIPVKFYFSNFFNSYVGISIFLIWFAAVFDPIGQLFFLRYIALFNIYLCIFLVIFLTNYKYLPLNFKTFSIIYLAFISPVYGFAIFIMRGGWDGNFIDTSYIASGILIITAVIYLNKSFVDYGIKSMILALQLLSLTIIIIQLNTLLSLDDSWLSFFTERSIALISFRDYGGFVLPYIYFLASPLLIFLVGYHANNFLSKKTAINFISTFFAILALVLSGTRSHLLIALMSLPFIYFLLKVKNKLETFVVFLIFFILGFLFFNIEIIQSMFSSAEASNSHKLSMLANYSYIFDDLLSLFFGQGYNAHEWSVPLSEMINVDGASKTELTYIEYIRVYGLIMSIPFFFILFYPIRRLMLLRREYIWLYPSYILYLVNAGLNPYMFSTNGMLSLGLIISVISIKDNYK